MNQAIDSRGTYEKNRKILRQIRENLEIIGFIYPPFANELFRAFSQNENAKRGERRRTQNRFGNHLRCNDPSPKKKP